MATPIRVSRSIIRLRLTFGSSSFSIIATMTGCELRAWRSSKHPSSAWRGRMPAGSYVAAASDSFEPREVAPGVWHPKHQSNDPLVESALRTNHGRLIMVFNPHLESIEGDAPPRRGR